jgi:peptidylprolyl isomerase
MKTVENGASVQLHYKGTFPDGEVFDDSKLRGEAMEILVGSGRLLPSFESALIGMTEGEVKNISLTSDEAYGNRTDNAVVAAPTSAFPENFPFEVGLTVQGSGPQGQPIMAKIISFDSAEVVLDHNHPLAGKDINFEIELVKIEDASETENTTEE